MRKQRFTTIGPAWWLLALLLLWSAYAHAQECTEAQLSAEFSGDPTARGYSTCTDDSCYVDKLNAPCTGNAACNKVDNILTREQIYATIIDSGELDTLANSTAPADAKRKTTLAWLLTASPWNMNDSSSQQKWKNVFPGPSAPLTNAKIDAAKQKEAPRCQAVCSKGSGCTLNEVSCGLRGTGCAP